jgi:hypothetical protein
VLVATAASGGLLAAFLRQESRVAVWLTLVLGGISVLCLTFLGVAAWGGDQPGTAASCPDPVLRWPRLCERPTVCFLTSVLSVEAHGRGHGRSADGPGPGRSP